MPAYNSPYLYQGIPGYQQPYQPPMQDRLSQSQNQYQATMPMYGQIQQPQQQMQMIQPMQLNGQMVDSLDVVRAKDVDMSGAVTYYPKADLSEIYTKRLMPDGTSQILTYRIAPEEPQQEQPQQVVTMETLNSLIGQLRNDVLQEIGGVKSLVNTFMSYANIDPSQIREGDK